MPHALLTMGDVGHLSGFDQQRLASGESARYWRHDGIPGVDLLNARYITYRYAKHTHAEFAIGVIEQGVEEFMRAGSYDRAGTGSIVVVNPEEVHTGHAGVPEGWAYRMTYPDVALMTDIAVELGAPPGTPYFPRGVIEDPETAALIRSTSRAAANGDSLAVSSLLRTTYGQLLRRHSRSGEPPRPADPPAVQRVRELLHESLIDPPSLEELARFADTSPFALLRAFRKATGLPPHAYLNQIRVHQARRLLDSGTRPAEVAAATGFADQAHLTRHFKRSVGVPPGAYQAAVRTLAAQ